MPGPLVPGTFKPTNFPNADAFPAPAPAPSGGSALSVFNGTNPNGTWSLYVIDDAPSDGGSIGGGWSLNITVLSPPTSTPTATASATVTAGRTPTATPCILGDINCDRIVDIRDYGLWRASFGQQGAGNPADLNGDGFVDIRDYGSWRANFGHMAGAAPRGTPGPASLASTQGTAGSGGLLQAEGASPVGPVIPLVGGLLGLGGLAGWRRRRPPSARE
jgi:MYXO-CTERM domain-containing protein